MTTVGQKGCLPGDAPSGYVRATLKNREWPGEEAISCLVLFFLHSTCTANKKIFEIL